MIAINIDMPDSCHMCPCLDGEYGICKLSILFPSKYNNIECHRDDRPIRCPLIQIQENDNEEDTQD